MIEEGVVFWIGAAIFGLAALMFALIDKRRFGDNPFFGSNIFVSFITAISYVVMALALGTSVAENGQPIYWTRWLFYVASCSILTVDIAFIANKNLFKKIEIALFTGITMFCGFLASWIVAFERWWFFGLSTVAYISMLYILFNRSSDNEVKLNAIKWFVLVSWSLFPLVWIVAPTGFGVITTNIEALLYLALDFITKIAFGWYMSTQQKK